MSNKNGNKLLIGRDSILDYLGVGRPVFNQFLEMGLPAVVIKQRWYAHTDNVDDFLRKLTRRQQRNIPMDAE